MRGQGLVPPSKFKAGRFDVKEAKIRGVLLKKITVGPYENNVYFLVDESQKESIIIDAAASAEEILNIVRGTRVKMIAQTHGHMDHVMALAEVRKATKAPVAIHLADEKAFGIRADIHLEDRQTLEIGQLQIQTLHTPGHTPGGLCFLMEDHLITGDTLFPGGPGKTASPEDFKQLLSSITQKIYPLPDSTVCHPGHGPETTVGASKKEYQTFASKKRVKPVYGDVLWRKT